MNRLLVIILFGFISSGKAQRPAGSVWTAINLPVRLRDHWQLLNDAGFRTIGFTAAGHQYLFRTGLRYSLAKGRSFSGGVALFFTRTSFHNYNNEFGEEFRTWQEYAAERKTKSSLTLGLRVRTEQRFFRENSKADAFIAHRFRARCSITYTIEDKWELQMASEYMQQLAKQKFNLDQYRLIVNSSYLYGENDYVRLGYMLVLWPTSFQHCLTVTVQKYINFHGTKKS